MIDKIFLLVEKKYRLRLFVLFFGMVISSFLEILSIGSIPVFLNVLLGTENIFSSINLDIDFLNNFTNKFDSKTLLLIISAFLVLVFGLKNLFLSFLIYLEAKFIYNIKVSNSTKLFNSYLNLPYITHVKTNSSKVIRNIIHENYQASTVLQIGLLTLREGLVMIVIFILLLSVSLIGIISLFTLGTLSLIFYLIFRAKLKKIGVIAQEKRADVLQKINEASGSIKDIKILGIENYVSSDFKSDVEEIENITFYEQILSKIPKILIEFFAIVTIFFVSLIAYKFNFEMEYMISMLSILGISTIRLMPAFNVITSCSTKIRYLYPSLSVVAKKFKDLKDLENSKKVLFNYNFNDNRKFEKLKFDNVSFYYEEHKKIFDKFSIEINRGEKIAIIGKSGSGKSTMLDLILGLIDATGGEITINNRKYGSDNNYFSYVPQNIYLIDNSIKKNITLGLLEKDIDEKHLKKIISVCELEEFVNELPEGLNTIVGEKGSLVSGGQKQRIAIARALYSNREILILDEGTNALDETTEQKIITNILESYSNKTLIFTTHKLDIMKHFDKVVEIRDKNIEIK